MRMLILPGLLLCLPAMALEALSPFLDAHCHECHDETGKGDLDLLELARALDQPENFAIWERVFHRVHAGEMPPKKKARPAALKQKQFLAALRNSLIATDRVRLARDGRVHGRRLTRREYEHVIRDLIGVDNRLTELLPEDPLSYGFETVADGQQFSQHHLNRYMQAADIILMEAFRRGTGEEARHRRRFSARQMDTGYSRADVHGDTAYAWPIKTMRYALMPRSTEVPEAGWYRMTIKNVRAINPKNSGVVWGLFAPCAATSPRSTRLA